MNPDISAQLAAVGVCHCRGGSARCRRQDAHGGAGDGDPFELAYDRSCGATGSRLSVPVVPGFAEYGFNVDTLESAQRLMPISKLLAAKPSTPARNTAVVVARG